MWVGWKLGKTGSQMKPSLEYEESIFHARGHQTHFPKFLLLSKLYCKHACIAMQSYYRGTFRKQAHSAGYRVGGGVLLRNTNALQYDCRGIQHAAGHHYSSPGRALRCGLIYTGLPSSSVVTFSAAKERSTCSEQLRKRKEEEIVQSKSLGGTLKMGKKNSSWDPDCLLASM